MTNRTPPPLFFRQALNPGRESVPSNTKTENLRLIPLWSQVFLSVEIMKAPGYSGYFVTFISLLNMMQEIVQRECVNEHRLSQSLVKSALIPS